MTTIRYQYEEPKTPERWNEQERRYAVKVRENLETLFSMMTSANTGSNISKKLLEHGLGNYSIIIGESGNVVFKVKA